MRASLVCNVFALLGFAWLVWLNFLVTRPELAATPEGVDLYAVDARLHSAVPFLVPGLLLLVGIILQLMSGAGGAK